MDDYNLPAGRCDRSGDLAREASIIVSYGCAHLSGLRMKRWLRQDANHVDRHGYAEQRQEHGDNPALLAGGAVHEFATLQFAGEAHIAPCRKQIYGYADRDKRHSTPQ